MTDKERILNLITEFLDNIDNIDCYMYMIRGLLDENIKLEKDVEIAQIKSFVNGFYFLSKEIEEYNSKL